MNYFTIFFNSRLFRFCFKEKFPELLGESRELRKVFFETIRIKHIEDESWYTETLNKILSNINSGFPIVDLQNEVEEKLFELYELNDEERRLVQSHASI